MAGQPAGNPYDLVDYPGHAFVDTHPARVAAVAILRGLEPAPVPGCRVLELGCGDGANLVPMAYQLPAARFLGIDLAAAPIARGRAFAASLGLGNVELLAQDIMDVTPALGEFDYIIAHGVYSWVPEPVRERLLACCGQLLAPNGVAFISYLAEPGTRLRDVFRRFLLRYVGEDGGAGERVARARTLARDFANELVSPDSYQQAMRATARELADWSDGAIFHDWLAPINAAASITGFAESARPHGLQFLGEAEYFAMCYRHDPLLASVHHLLARLEEQDVLAKEQLLDELRCRRFRQTLLCRAGVTLSTPVPARVQHLAAASRLRLVGEPALDGFEVAEFVSPHDVSVRLDHPVAKAALVRLAATWPRSVPFAELLAGARSAARRETGATLAEDEAVLSSVLLACAGAAHVELSSWAPPLAAKPGERPRASAVARAEIERGPTVTTLRHQHLRISDPLGAALVRLLDGTRDRAALLAELTALAERGAVELPAAADGADPSAAIVAGLEQSLEGLAQAALLEA